MCIVNSWPENKKDAVRNYGFHAHKTKTSRKFDKRRYTIQLYYKEKWKS